MPATPEELARAAVDLLDSVVMPDTEFVWQDGTVCTESEHRTLNALMVHEAMQRNHVSNRSGKGRLARRKALRLLRQLLSDEQRRTLNVGRYFYVEAPSGRMYRFYPYGAGLHECARHGKRWFISHSFCLHPIAPLPDPDVTISQLLLLSENEEAFRQKANIRERRQDQWDGDYHRRLRRARLERERIAV